MRQGRRQKGDHSAAQHSLLLWLLLWAAAAPHNVVEAQHVSPAELEGAGQRVAQDGRPVGGGRGGGEGGGRGNR